MFLKAQHYNLKLEAFRGLKGPPIPSLKALGIGGK